MTSARHEEGITKPGVVTILGFFASAIIIAGILFRNQIGDALEGLEDTGIQEN